MKHVMIDLETMGKAAGCAIISIGAVEFDPGIGELGREFYCNIDLRTCLAAGLKVDGETVMWWMQQSDAARQAVYAKETHITLGAALANFSSWFSSVGGRYIWCHGATFDAPILGAAYTAIGSYEPWRYGDVRDTRTLFDLADVKPNREVGTHHNALDDAKTQALAVIEAYGKLAVYSNAQPRV